MVTAVLLPPEVLTAAERYAHEVKARFADRCPEITLFGSHVRGETHEESDVDLAVVVDDLDGPTWDALVGLGITLGWETEVPLSASPFDRKTFEQWLRWERAMALHIVNEGIRL